MTTWLRPFNADGKCPKCTTVMLATEYHPSTVIGMCEERRREAEMLSQDPASVPGRTTEHLCRHCGRCHYSWSEYTAEVPPL